MKEATTTTTTTATTTTTTTTVDSCIVSAAFVVAHTRYILLYLDFSDKVFVVAKSSVIGML